MQHSALTYLHLFVHLSYLSSTNFYISVLVQLGPASYRKVSNHDQSTVPHIQSFFCLQNLQSSFIYYVFSPSFIYQASELQLYRHRSSTVSYCICILQSSFIYSICRPHSSKTSAVIVYLPYFMFSCTTSAASLLIIYTTSAVIVNKLNNHICSHC